MEFNIVDIIEFPEIEEDTLPKLLRRRTKAYGHRIFMQSKEYGIWKTYSWSQVFEKVKYFGLGLLTLGVEREDVVAMIGDNKVELYWSEYGALSIGARVVCLFPDMREDEIKYVLDNSQARFVIAEDQEQVDKLLKIIDQLPLIKNVIFWDYKGVSRYNHPSLMKFGEVLDSGRDRSKRFPDLFDNCIDQGKGNDIAIVSYTSGTTGAPKGVIMTFDYLFDTSFRVLMPHPFEPFTKYVSCMPPAWMTEQSFGFTWSLVVPFVIYFPEDPETILADIREVGAGFLAFGPRQYESFVSMCQARIEDAGRIRKGIYELGMKFAEWKSNRQKSNFFLKFLNLVFYLILFKKIADYLGLSKGKAALCGGSAMAPQVYSFFRRLGIDVRNTYGLSEVGLLCMHTGDDYNAETMGKWFVSHPKFGPPIEGKLAKNGELLVRGGSGFSGYYRNQEATEEATKDGWYYTGDVLTISEMGDLVYLDRLKDIKYLKGGQIFAPQFIETRLRFSPYIKDGIVVGDESRDYPVALINIDAEMTGKWAEKNNVVYSTFPDLSQNEKVINLIRNELKKINKLLGDQVKVKKFVNLTKELDPDEAELTRTRKLKRNVLEETYKNLINEIYADKPEYASIVPVKYRDGRVRNVEKKIIINDL